MSLKEDFELSQDSEFRGKLKAAIAKVAIEVAKNDTHENYQERVRFIREFVRNPEDWTARAAPIVVASGIDTSSTDQQLITRVTLMWDLFAKGT